MWNRGEDEALDNYLSELLDAYPGYIPAQLMAAGWKQCTTGLDERKIEVLRMIDSDARQHLPVFSPLFLSWLGAEIRMSQDALDSYTNDGVSAQERARRLALNKTKVRLAWSVWGLVRISPEVSLPRKTNGSVIVHHRDIMSEKMTTEELRTLAANSQADVAERSRAIRTLAVVSPEGQLQFLARWLRDYSPEIAEAAATAVSSYGEVAVSHVLGAMRDPSRRLGVRSFCVWALLRIGSVTEETKTALSELVEGTRGEEREYAAVALEYMEKQGVPPV